jgi:RNA polymerase sigma factor (sigma-70 family)
MKWLDNPDPLDDPAGPPMRLGELYRRYAGWLLRLLKARFGEDADDLVQETYIRMRRYDGKVVVHPKALLIKVASHVAYDERRKASAQGRSRQIRLEDLSAGAGPSCLDDQTQLLLLKQVILSIPLTYRDVFVLSRFAGLSYEEIAERLGLSVKTVEWRMSKALAHCATDLGTRG